MRKLSSAEILNQRQSIKSMKTTERFPISILLNNIRSMHNVGSIFRTADAACIRKIYLTGYTATPPRSEIEKTALGATETVPWEYIKDPISCIQKLKKSSTKIFALEQCTNSKSIYNQKLHPNENYCLVVGNEVFGIDDEIINACDATLDIPMFGMKHSLNVSVATGIAIFEWLRKIS